ncbi:MAG TPA: hypothetical protein VJA21_19010 [Verrucomicrobiae bacterium]
MSTLAASAPTPDEEKIPPLRPPRGPIPAGLWEQYGFWMVAGGVVLLLVAAGAIWFLLRPKPAPPVPPATAARQALESLRQQPETGAILSRVSQVVRLYFGAAFGLPPGEHTTAELCNSLNAAQEPGQDLARQVSLFLRECDERKFAPSPRLPPMGAVARADRLVTDAEARRAQLRALAASSQSSPPGQTAEPSPPSTAGSTP